MVFKKKKFGKNIENITTGTVGASVGSSILGSIGGNIAQSGQNTLQNTTRFLPTAGTAIGAGITLDVIKELNPKKKKKK